MNKNVKRLLIFLGVLAVIVVFCVIIMNRPIENFSEKYAGADLSVEVEGLNRSGSYSGYLAAQTGKTTPKQSVVVDVLSYENITPEGAGEEAIVEEKVNYTDAKNVTADKALFTGLDSEVSWSVDIPEEGFYNITLDFLLPESHGVAAERCIKINGEVPFDDAQNISFTRVWKDSAEKTIDNQGNEIRPTQIEEFVWQSAYVRDDRGYAAEPYMFYFNKGVNTITLVAENEPMIIKGLTVAAVEEKLTYEQYTALQPSTAGAKDYEQIIQGEDSTYRSESSLYAKYDRSSPTTQPYSVTNTVLNYVGGEVWSKNGQWIEWDFEVPEDGFYNIMIKGRQNYARGAVSCRKIYIDGKVPFAELEALPFGYDNDWQSKVLGTDNDNPYNFYLTKGTHTIRLEATLGDLGQILIDLEDSTFRLNQMYRKILVYTGASPDQYRDYHIENVYPEVITAMDIEAKRLYKLVDDTVAYSGQKADNIASAQTVAIQLERFLKKPGKITTEFTQFKDNITALGTASLNMNESKLDIDYIVVSGTDVKPTIDKANFFTKLWHECKSFFASFIVDYNAVGDVYTDDDEVITVWITTGRDQGTILKTMIDDTFTPETGIPVNLEIVGADAVLNAVMAGRGPNVVLSMGADVPVNYALRGASEDLTQFDDWQEVFTPERFSESSYEQYRLDGHIYGIPETQTFNVMFYRKDVLEELELAPPQTWQELIEMLPTIQGKNLSVGLPSAAGSSGANSVSAMSNNPDLSMYFSLLFQNGGDMYNEAGTKTTVNTEAGIKAFDDYVRYFNDYGLPTIYDFVSRFRSGEMPIGISAYSTYNTLVVSAPEIRGLWDFTLIPGTEKTNPDGTTYIDRSDFITGSASIMIREESQSAKQKAWEFLKWWSSKDIQVRFGREMEALLGSSARYATANREAFSSLSWSADDIKVLNDQWDQSVGIREVPGGYYTGRHIANAIRKVFNEKVDTREAIIDYSILIDEEIIKKRKEFGLPVEED